MIQRRRRRDLRLSQYLGNFATRCAAPGHLLIGTYSLSMNVRQYHYARDSVPWVKVLPCGSFYIDDTGGQGEATQTPGLTVTMSIEYPAGSYHQVTWGGSASWVPAAGQIGLSDKVQVAIPKGAKFWTRQYRVWASGAYAYASNGVQSGGGVGYDAAGGDATNSTATDWTMTGGAYADQNYSTGVSFNPVLLVGPMTAPSVAVLACSWANGYHDTAPGSPYGDTGYPCRAIGPYFGYSNWCSENDTAAAFIVTSGSASTIRRSLLKYFSHVWSHWGIDEFFVGGAANAAAAISNIQQALGLASGIPGRRIIQSCYEPFTTSTDGWVTTANQTVNASGGTAAQHGTFNTGVRTRSLFGVAGYDDAISLWAEHAFPTGDNLWVPSQTTDGNFPSASAGYATVATKTKAGQLIRR